MLISLIIPVYNEEEGLERLFARLEEVLGCDPDNRYELVFLDDGSQDRSFQILKAYAQRTNLLPVRVIRLARNAGTHVGFQVAARYCRGNAAIYLAADLQCPVEVAPELAIKFCEGHEIVWGLRTERKDPLLTRTLASGYYFLMRLLVRREMRFHNIETFMVGRKVLDCLKNSREPNSNLLMLISGLGFSQGTVNLVRQERKQGRSSWSLAKRIKLLVDSLLSFTYLPVRAISLLGIAISLAGFLMAGVQVYEKLSGAPRPQGWTFLVVLILLLSGFQMLMLGLLGEYLWRILDQVNSRPMFVIDQLVGFEEQKPALEQSGTASGKEVT